MKKKINVYKLNNIPNRQRNKMFNNKLKQYNLKTVKHKLTMKKNNKQVVKLNKVLHKV